MNGWMQPRTLPPVGGGNASFLGFGVCPLPLWKAANVPGATPASPGATPE